MLNETENDRPTSPTLAHFFVTHRQVAWVFLIANLVWGCFCFYTMPQRKDPYIPMRRSLVTVTWPGASARQVEDQVTKPIEQAASRSTNVAKIESVSMPGVSFVYLALDEYIESDMDKAFDDIKIKLDGIHNLPPGAGPIQYEKDFGDTAALTMSIASPQTGGVYKYSNRNLDNFSDLIGRTFQKIGSVSKVTRSGVVPESVNITYSQATMAALGVKPGDLPQVIAAHNVDAPGGLIDLAPNYVRIDSPQGLQDENGVGNVQVATGPFGPVHLRDIANVERGYQDLPMALDYSEWRDASGVWMRSPAVTIAVYMRTGGNIAQTGKAIDTAMASLKGRIPADLIVTRISDQPAQVAESVGLFARSLAEGILLIVLVALIGFQDWRSALLMACAIPLTLAMTGGFMALLGIDIQQVSVASLIIALGLLVDDPVVAGDAIKREMAAGRRPEVAAWLGPTKLATAIAFATFTNIVAYLPFLMVKGDTGRFLYALPVVMTCALIASRIVSMTFVPLLGYYLLRSGAKPAAAPSHDTDRLRTGYRALVTFCIRYRKAVMAWSVLFLIAGGLLFTQIKQSFFPYDAQYLSYVEVALPENASLAATDAVTRRAENIIEDTAARIAGPRALVSLNTFVGHAPPRFWFTLFPQQPQPSYAMIVVHMSTKTGTMRLHTPLQEALTRGIPDARIDVHELETGRPIGIPVAVRISGDDPDEVRRIGGSVEAIYSKIPIAARVRDDWGASGVRLKVVPDPQRAFDNGVTDQDIALATATATSGSVVGLLRSGDKQIPIVVRLRAEDRPKPADIGQVSVYASKKNRYVLLRDVASVITQTEPIVLRRRNQFPCITVSCFPAPGHLATDVVAAAQPQMRKLEASLPPGYTIEQGGEIEEQVKAFLQLVSVLVVSIACIYLALVFLFKNAVKPLLVFAAVPYGLIGSVIGLRVMSEPFGFMAFLGIISLMGVLVSHIVVLFDFIEAAQHRGDSLETALIEAGVQRLRPILITVGATVIAFMPLALHGGPLWEPLCYAQIGGLTIGAFSTLLLVPALYTIFVRDWKIVQWKAEMEVDTAKR